MNRNLEEILKHKMTVTHKTSSICTTSHMEGLWQRKKPRVPQSSIMPLHDCLSINKTPSIYIEWRPEDVQRTLLVHLSMDEALQTTVIARESSPRMRLNKVNGACAQLSGYVNCTFWPINVAVASFAGSMVLSMNYPLDERTEHLNSSLTDPMFIYP